MPGHGGAPGHERASAYGGAAYGGAAGGGAAGADEVPPPADVYGPDDPGYGPPDPSWYERRKRELEREREEEEFLAEAAGETPPARGVFERSRPPGSGKAEPTSLDLLLEADDETNHERDPLDRVRDLYLAAEAVSETDLDRRFEELLERQRTLIGAYLERSRPPMPDAPQVAVSDTPR